MRAALVRARSELRSRWAATVALIVLVGLGAGVVMAAAEGARRTQTAFPRFLESAHAAEVLLSVPLTGIRSFYPDVARLPEVERLGVAGGVNVFYIHPSGAADIRITGVASVDGRAAWSVDRPNLLSGRLPRRDHAFEIAVNRFMANQLDLSVGDRITMRAFPGGDQELVDPLHVSPTAGLRQTFTVVGITVAPSEVLPLAEQDSIPSFILTPAYFRRYADPQHLQFDGAFIRLKPGTDIGRFRADIDRLAAPHQAEIGEGGIFFGNLRDHSARVQRSIRPQWIALALFAFLTALAALLGIGQIMARQVFLDASEYPILRSLGMTRSELVTAAFVRVLLVALAGGLLAAVVAVLASPLFPIGPARLAEPNPGFSVNWALTAIGIGATVLLLLAVAAIPAWRAASAPAGVGGLAEVAGSERRSKLADAATRLGLSPTAAAGVRMALEPGHGRTAVPVRSAIVGLIAAIAAVAAAFTFGANLNRLVATPRLYGWNWNVSVDASFGVMSKEDALRRLGSNPSISAIAGGSYGDITIRQVQIPAIGIDPLKGSVFPTLIEGREPRSGDELVLGTSTLHDIHAEVGDTVPATANGQSRPMKIVGRAVFPFFGRGSFTPTGLGEGAATRGSVFPAIDFAGQIKGRAYNFYLVRFVPDTDASAGLARVKRDMAQPCPPILCAYRTAQPPTDITNYARIRATPLILAGLLALLGVAMIAHALAIGVRRRRRDLALLKTLGFVRGQMGATVAWQATTFAAIALLIGIPLGVGAGRWVWTLFAGQLGVPPEPIVNVPVLLLVVPATLLIANLVAAVPGQIASRMHPAAALRTE